MLFKCYHAVLYLFWVIIRWPVLTGSIVLRSYCPDIYYTVPNRTGDDVGFINIFNVHSVPQIFTLSYQCAPDYIWWLQWQHIVGYRQQQYRALGTKGQGGTRPSSFFGRSVSPIWTRGSDYVHHSTTCPPWIFRHLMVTVRTHCRIQTASTVMFPREFQSVTWTPE